MLLDVGDDDGDEADDEEDEAGWAALGQSSSRSVRRVTPQSAGSRTVAEAWEETAEEAARSTASATAVRRAPLGGVRDMSVERPAPLSTRVR